jgi:hypothetical protein
MFSKLSDPLLQGFSEILAVADWIFDDTSFLINCAKWIAESRHLELLHAVLAYGFDPTEIDCPDSNQWPVTCSPDWIAEEFTPDPFFVHYIALLVKDNPGRYHQRPQATSDLALNEGSIQVSDTVEQVLQARHTLGTQSWRDLRSLSRSGWPNMTQSKATPTFLAKHLCT